MEGRLRGTTSAYPAAARRQLGGAHSTPCHSSPVSPADVAAACGSSSQAHLTTAFSLAARPKPLLLLAGGAEAATLGMRAGAVGSARSRAISPKPLFGSA